MTRMRMYGNWRSAAAFRVRVALNLKGIAYEETFLDLDAGEQFKPEFLAINPQGAVPAFFDGDGPPLTQSLAILDYLEDVHPEVPLLPADPRARARARSLAQAVACDTHPSTCRGCATSSCRATTFRARACSTSCATGWRRG